MKNPRRFSSLSSLLLIPAFIALTTQTSYARVELVAFTIAIFGLWLARKKLAWDARPPRWCAPLRSWSRNPWFCCAVPAAVSVIARLALLPWMAVPHPQIPDEFSYIFFAKTILLRRLATPPHPLWHHFEAIHILSQPTYSSMYFAGQGIFLALGKLVTGSFFGGVILSTALFCAALTWFLRSFVSPGWAFYGGIIAALRLAFSYWDNSYWGGSVPALAGALALGGYARLSKRWSPGPAALFALGIALLANTRPYEGLGLAATLFLALGWKGVREWSHIPRRRAACSALVVFTILTGTGWAMTRHWKAVTGNSLTLPYQVNLRTYGWPLALPFTAVRPVNLEYPEFRAYRALEVHEHELVTQPAEIPISLAAKTAVLWLFYFCPALTPLLLFAGSVLRAKRMRILWIAGAIVMAEALIEQTTSPHYSSPASAIVILFLVRGLQAVSHLRWNDFAFGPAIVRLVIPMALVTMAYRALEFAAEAWPKPRPWYISCCSIASRFADRQPVVDKLSAEPGKHLVIVAYDVAEYNAFDWVYNEPDIDSSKIVFARDMGPRGNQELFDYYPDRRVWRVRIRGSAAVLTPHH